jgi:cytochrome oxidase assembly protein ShyY1
MDTNLNNTFADCTAGNVQEIDQEIWLVISLQSLDGEALLVQRGYILEKAADTITIYWSHSCE